MTRLEIEKDLLDIRNTFKDASVYKYVMSTKKSKLINIRETKEFFNVEIRRSIYLFTLRGNYVNIGFERHVSNIRYKCKNLHKKRIYFKIQ